MAGIMWLGLGGPTHKTICWHSTVSGAQITVDCNGKTFYAPQLTDANMANNVAIKVDGLVPNTEYDFTVKENGVVVYKSDGGRYSTYPRLQTHPKSGIGWKVAWLSCMQGQPSWLSTPQYLANDPSVRVVFAVGDVPYCDDTANTFNGVTTIDVLTTTTKEAYFTWYEMWHSNPAIRWMLRRVELVRSANDHEYYDSIDPNHSLWPYRFEMQAAAKAWQIGNPTNSDSGIDSGALYTVCKTGPIDHFLLDTQTYKGTNNTDSTLLGSNQLNWLLSKLSSSTAEFKAIQSGYPWQHSDHPDSWFSRVSELNTINNFINTNAIKTTFWPQGDYHSPSVAYTSGNNYRLGINLCPDGVNLFHGKVGYDSDCVYKISGNPNDTTSVRYCVGILDISSDWKTVKWSIETTDNKLATLIDGVLVAGKNEWKANSRSVYSNKI